MSELFPFEYSGESPTQPPKKSFISIRWILPLFVVAPVIAGIALTGWFAYISGRQAVEDTVNQISTEVAKNIQTEVVSYLEVSIVTSKMLVAEVNSDVLNIQDMATLTNYLKETRETFQTTRASQNIANLFYANEAGKHATSQSDSTNFDRRKRPWYEAAEKAQKATWAEVYNDQKTSDLVLTRATPIQNQAGNLEGVFGIDIKLDSLSDFLQNLEVGKTGQAFILEMIDSQQSTGELIATPTDEDLFKEQAGMNASIQAKDSENELVQKTAKHILDVNNNLLFPNCDLSKLSNEATINQKNDNCEFKIDGKRYRFRVNYLGDQDIKIKWLIVVTIPQQDYMGSINSIVQKALLIGIGITILASLLALIGAMYIIRPIEKLNQAADDIKQHQFEPQTLADVRNRPDEFSILADVFDDMATVVVSREQSLSDQVKQLETEKLQYGGKGGDRYALDVALRQAKQARRQYRQR
ncbi:PDC sensor domain-containing protein [Leptothoe spongobia]|uniref:histidine kinase n=1 Tax=Leptothoe spongobia TAU-MAC 1115 TaxID=1967444 RepID=A0A947DDV3_9CYAN|nr:cache domain-containing protein [Leptothoe spongobia]MBT9314534.1 Cache 3/Cache 2 fusion domain-containing protein [Leptothoe spongobia TAU-MAC 1115]